MQKKWPGWGWRARQVHPGCPVKEHLLVNEGSPSVLCSHPGAFERLSITVRPSLIFTSARAAVPETRGAGEDQRLQNPLLSRHPGAVFGSPSFYLIRTPRHKSSDAGHRMCQREAPDASFK